MAPLAQGKRVCDDHQINDEARLHSLRPLASSQRERVSSVYLTRASPQLVNMALHRLPFVALAPAVHTAVLDGKLFMIQQF